MNVTAVQKPHLRRTALLSLLLIGILLMSDPGRWAPASLLGGSALGLFASRSAWKRFRSRIQTSFVVAYRADNWVHELLLTLGLLTLAPASIGALAKLVFANPATSAGVFLVLVSAVWVYELAYLYMLNRYEARNGPLEVKWFHDRSSMGQEGLVGRELRTSKPCNPRGQVLIGSERWTARSFDGSTIPAGELVRVRSVEGIILIIQPINEELASVETGRS